MDENSLCLLRGDLLYSQFRGGRRCRRGHCDGDRGREISYPFKRKDNYFAMRAIANRCELITPPMIGVGLELSFVAMSAPLSSRDESFGNEKMDLPIVCHRGPQHLVPANELLVAGGSVAGIIERGLVRGYPAIEIVTVIVNYLWV